MKKLLLFLMTAALFGSCVKDYTESLGPDSRAGHADDDPGSVVYDNGLGSESDMIVLGEKITNPYSVEIMREAQRRLAVTRPEAKIMKIAVTDLYVRILPQDAAQLDILKNELGLELFDYPLDYMIENGGMFYHDPSLPEDQITWQYTTVKPNFQFPAGFVYEVLDECYIPAYDTANPQTFGADDSFLAMLEREAFDLAGLCDEFSDFGPRPSGLSHRPVGDIKVYSDGTGKWEPVKGVKIRCHTVIKWSTTYTNILGHYEMDSKFLLRPHYAIVFDNKQGFDLYGNWGPLARANYNMGWHRNTGHSRNIDIGSRGWAYCIINNA